MDNGSTPTLTVRQAQLRDLPLLRELWLETLREQREHPFYPFAHDEDDARLTGDLAQALQRPEFAAFLAFDPTGTPVGFCAAEQQERRLGTPRYFLYWHGIYVIPAWRAHVASVRLMAALGTWAEARNLAVIECDVATGRGAPWWHSIPLPMRAAHVHYVAKVEDYRRSLSVFGQAVDPPPLPPRAVALEDLPESAGIEDS